MRSSPNLIEITQAKTEFSELFAETNPALYHFLNSMVDGLITDHAVVPQMSEYDMAKLTTAIFGIVCTPAGQEIFATEVTRKVLFKP